MCGNKRFNLFARTLKANLETTLLRLIGLNWVIFMGVFNFRYEHHMSFIEFRTNTMIQKIQDSFSDTITN